MDLSTIPLDRLALFDTATLYRYPGNASSDPAQRRYTSQSLVHEIITGRFAHETLACCLPMVNARAQQHLTAGDFMQAMLALEYLVAPINTFFDKVTVNVDDRARRENRLRLLSSIQAVMNQVADFSRIQGTHSAVENSTKAH